MTDPPLSTWLYLVRHEAIDDAMHGRCCGRTDAPLSPIGLERAGLLAAAFADRQLAAVYSSPLRRATATAIPIAANAGLEVICLDALSEIDFGRFEGLAFVDIARRHPDLYKQWMASPTAVAFPQGESFAGMAARAGGAVRKILERHAGAAAVVVTHIGPIRAILGEVLSISGQDSFRIDIQPGSVSPIEWVAGQPVLHGLNLPARSYSS
jgi:ribonuclease H / adenosylcobalamin/alpha-ribazole phosphatase